MKVFIGDNTKETECSSEHQKDAMKQHLWVNVVNVVV